MDKRHGTNLIFTNTDDAILLDNEMSPSRQPRPQSTKDSTVQPILNYLMGMPNFPSCSAWLELGGSKLLGQLSINVYNNEPTELKYSKNYGEHI